ncbi:MAG: DUF5320 domain-containing protein [Archaeoglobaceae archaeon]
MPRGDRTGPMGLGPRTGRAAGFCSGFGAPGFANPVRGGRGFWGSGYGRGFGFGPGRGFRGPIMAYPEPVYPASYAYPAGYREYYRPWW